MFFCGLISHYLAQLVLMAKQLAPVQRYPKNRPVFQSSQVVSQILSIGCMFENLCGCVWLCVCQSLQIVDFAESCWTHSIQLPTQRMPGSTIHQKHQQKQLVNLSYFNHEGNFWTIGKQQKHPLTKTDHTAVMVAHLPPGCDGIFTPCSYQRWQRWRLRSHRVGQLRRKTWRKQRLQKWVASGYPKMGSKWVTCQSSFIESNPWIRK